MGFAGFAAVDFFGVEVDVVGEAHGGHSRVGEWTKGDESVKCTAVWRSSEVMVGLVTGVLRRIYCLA